MADTMKPFEDVKNEIAPKVAEGYTLDDDKLGDLKAAYEAANGDLSKLDLSSFTKKQENANGSNQQQPQDNSNTAPDQPTVINETEAAQEAPADENWKTGVLKEWQEWSDQKNKTLAQYEDPEHPENLSFRIFANEEEQAKNNFEADLSYAGPRNVTMKGKDGNIPSEEYFEKLVAQIKAANGPKIEFGNIQSEEFKAKLLAACLKDPEIQVINPPSPEQIATWDKSLQDMVAQAKPRSDEGHASTSPQYDAAKNIVKENLKNNTEINIESLEPEKKALYTAAAMELAGDKIKSGEVTLKGALKYDELVKAAEKLPTEEQKAVKPGLTSYTIMSLKQTALKRGVNTAEGSQNDWKAIDANTTGLTDEQKKLRELRGQARSGDSAARTELDKRREQTMTEDYKYVCETEMEADGKTPKKDENGKPVYKKDENGNFVYKTDDKGNKVESAAYQAFKARQSGNTK